MIATKYKIGQTVWFITPSKRVYPGLITSTAENGCHTIKSGEFSRMEFDEELYPTREEAYKQLTYK